MEIYAYLKQRTLLQISYSVIDTRLYSQIGNAVRSCLDDFWKSLHSLLSMQRRFIRIARSLVI